PPIDNFDPSPSPPRPEDVISPQAPAPERDDSLPLALSVPPPYPGAELIGHGVTATKSKAGKGVLHVIAHMDVLDARSIPSYLPDVIDALNRVAHPVIPSFNTLIGHVHHYLMHELTPEGAQAIAALLRTLLSITVDAGDLFESAYLPELIGCLNMGLSAAQTTLYTKGIQYNGTVDHVEGEPGAPVDVDILPITRALVGPFLELYKWMLLGSGQEGDMPVVSGPVLEPYTASMIHSLGSLYGVCPALVHPVLDMLTQTQGVMAVVSAQLSATVLAVREDKAERKREKRRHRQREGEREGQSNAKTVCMSLSLCLCDCIKANWDALAPAPVPAPRVLTLDDEDELGDITGSTPGPQTQAPLQRRVLTPHLSAPLFMSAVEAVLSTAAEDTYALTELSPLLVSLDHRVMLLESTSTLATQADVLRASIGYLVTLVRLCVTPLNSIIPPPLPRERVDGMEVEVEGERDRERERRAVDVSLGQCRETVLSMLE
ncbi:hypothetical protein KIPB_007472, partial [Kipferlia bialata]